MLHDLFNSFSKYLLDTFYVQGILPGTYGIYDEFGICGDMERDALWFHTDCFGSQFLGKLLF